MSVLIGLLFLFFGAKLSIGEQAHVAPLADSSRSGSLPRTVRMSTSGKSLLDDPPVGSDGSVAPLPPSSSSYVQNLPSDDAVQREARLDTLESGGTKYVVVTNKNNMQDLPAQKKNRNYAILEEGTTKMHAEEMQKRSMQDQTEALAEQLKMQTLQAKEQLALEAEEHQKTTLREQKQKKQQQMEKQLELEATQQEAELKAEANKKQEQQQKVAQEAAVKNRLNAERLAESNEKANQQRQEQEEREKAAASRQEQATKEQERQQQQQQQEAESKNELHNKQVATEQQTKANQAQVDDLRSRLQRAGARTGPLVVSVMWDRKNDLDLHLECPAGQPEIFYGRRNSCGGGTLDVDMNAGCQTREPVENIYWSQTPPAGHYTAYVVNYRYCENDGERYRYTVAIRKGDAVQLYHREIQGAGARGENIEFNYP